MTINGSPSPRCYLAVGEARGVTPNGGGSLSCGNSAFHLAGIIIMRKDDNYAKA